MTEAPEVLQQNPLFEMSFVASIQNFVKASHAHSHSANILFLDLVKLT